MELDKHFTATTYILSSTEPEVLLHFHEKLQAWLPPGGHLETNETPYEAALREIKEETDIDEQHLEFMSNGEPPRRIDERVEMLTMPHYLLSEKIEENHFHLDWIYFAKIDPANFDATTRTEEFRWFTILDLNEESELFENVRALAVKGIEKFY